MRPLCLMLPFARACLSVLQASPYPLLQPAQWDGRCSNPITDRHSGPRSHIVYPGACYMQDPDSEPGGPVSTAATAGGGGTSGKANVLPGWLRCPALSNPTPPPALPISAGAPPATPGPKPHIQTAPCMLTRSPKPESAHLSPHLHCRLTPPPPPSPRGR